MHHTQDKSSALGQGVTIFVFLTALTLLEYFIAVAVNNTPLLIVVALVKAGLVLYYYMHIGSLNEDDHGAGHDSYAYKTGTDRLGLWLFLLSDAFVFLGLGVARFNLLGLTRPELAQLFGLFVTNVLLISSFSMNRAETLMAHGDTKGFMNWSLVTMILGLGFFFGVVIVEWHTIPSIAGFVLGLFGEHAGAEPLTASGTAAGAIFFMMTGMHAFHVLTGLALMQVVRSKAGKGYYSAEKHWGVEAATIYWHFVDVVWIFFYPALYLIGKLV